MAVETEPRAKRNRTRSPSYPYLDLPAALEKAAILWNVEGKHPAVVSVVMQHWGYKEESSTGYSCVAALKKFGLVDHDGIGETRQIRLSPLALAILLDRDPGSADRRDALRRAALNPGIHAELWERYGADLPSDQTLRRFLVIEKTFNESSVDELLAGYKASVAFAGLGRAATAAPLGNGGNGAAAIATAAALPVAPVPLPAEEDTRRAEAPRHAHKAPGRAASPAAGSWQDRDETAAPAALTASFPPPARPLATNSGVPAASSGPVPEHNGRGSAKGPGGRQTDLFGQHDDRFDPSVAEELLPPLPGRRAPDAGANAASGNGANGFHVAESTAEPVSGAAEAAGGGAGAPSGPWSLARRELPVPLDNGLVARVPYPMSEEDFSLLIDTLQLWKKRLVRPQGAGG